MSTGKLAELHETIKGIADRVKALEAAPSGGGVYSVSVAAGVDASSGITADSPVANAEFVAGDELVAVIAEDGTDQTHNFWAGAGAYSSGNSGDGQPVQAGTPPFLKQHGGDLSSTALLFLFRSA